MTRAISPKGLTLIQKYEGFRSRPTQLPDGRWVMGFGHVDRRPLGPSLAPKTARDLLVADVAPYERVVNDAVTVPLSQAQFDVLVSFAYSIGAAAFLNSQVLRRVNAGQLVAAACAIEAWRKTEVDGEEQISEALVCRRAVEKAMFLKDIPGVGAPSPVIRARLDHAATVLGVPPSHVSASTLMEAPEPSKDEPSKDEPPKVERPETAPLDAAARLTEILRSEPATAAVLSAPPISALGEGEEEIFTAHAKPSARSASPAQEPLPVDRRIRTARDRVRNEDGVSGVALILFGVALALTGVSQWLSHPLGWGEILTSILLGAAGASLAVYAAADLRRAPLRPREAGG